METKRLYPIVSIVVIALTSVLTNCADPESPFTAGAAKITSKVIGETSSDTITIGDSLNIELTINGVEFFDSIGTSFEYDSLWRNDLPEEIWFHPIRFNYKCTKTGRRSFTYHAFSHKREPVLDSQELFVRGISASITGQPCGTEVDERNPAYLSVHASGSDTIQYRWFRNGTLLSDYNDDTLHIDSVVPGNSGGYLCVVENGWGFPDTSETAIVNVRHVNRNPVLIYDTEIIVMKETDFIRKVIVANDPDGDTMQLMSSNIDSLVSTGEDIVYETAGDSLIFSIRAVWIPKHSPRQFRINAVFSDGHVFDTINIPFAITDSNIPPRWNHNPYIDTVKKGETISLPLNPLFEDPDNDPVDLQLLDGGPENDLISYNGGINYTLRSVYVVENYSARIVAQDIYGAADTLTINVMVEGGD